MSNFVSAQETVSTGTQEGRHAQLIKAAADSVLEFLPQSHVVDGREVQINWAFRGASQLKGTWSEVQGDFTCVYCPVKATGFAFDPSDPKLKKFVQTVFELSIQDKIQEFECGRELTDNLGGAQSSIYLSDETMTPESALSLMSGGEDKAWAAMKDKVYEGRSGDDVQSI